MKISEGRIKGVHIISSPWDFSDNRGALIRLYDDRFFREHGINVSWLQQSYSYTDRKNILRGLHVQRNPFTEAKLITIVNGEMFWVVVDLRKNSPTFGNTDSFILSRKEICGLSVMRGFAHGCLSLSDNCNLVINSDNYYSHEHGAGILWNDLDLGIKWPLGDDPPVISDEHRAYPTFDSFRKIYGGI